MNVVMTFNAGKIGVNDMNSECQHCGKKGDDFDLAGDGPSCLNPVSFSPAVGEWQCNYQPPTVVNGQPQLVATRAVPAVACPVCDRTLFVSAFTSGKQHCTGCGNAISLGENN